MATADLRPLSEAERAIITRLLSLDFPGRDGLAEQLRSASVRPVDEYGSLAIETSGRPASVHKRIPVEAEGRDEDGVAVYLLLHVVDGLASELEIYKADGSPLLRKVDASSLQVFSLPK
jgi:hypothetical protein